MKFFSEKNKKGLDGFIAYIEKDAELAKRLQEAADNYEGDKTNMNEIINGTVIPIAAEKGFSFSAEEYIEYLQTEVKRRLANIAVSDDEIGTVTGGVGDVEVSGDTNGDMTIVDNHIEYNITQINIIITPDTSPDTLRAIGQALSGK